jgi:hypothetical protein
MVFYTSIGKRFPLNSQRRHAQGSVFLKTA